MKPLARQVFADQAPQLAATLADAFQNEPAFTYITPAAEPRLTALMRAFPVFVREDLVKGAAFATLGVEAVTLWRAPGHAHDGLWDTVRLLPAFVHALRSGTFRGERVARSIDHHLPKTPVWYLHFAGCAPAHQGKGLGGAAIRAGLARADRDGLPAYLETANPTNVGFYNALGFTVVSEWEIPRGPHFWGMRRDPH